MMIGERTRVARARKNLSMKALGDAVGVTAQAIKKYEHDEAMPTSSVFLKLCKVLDISDEWLMAPEPLDFRSTETAPQGRHAKYWVREAIAELREQQLVWNPFHTP